MARPNALATPGAAPALLPSSTGQLNVVDTLGSVLLRWEVCQWMQSKSINPLVAAQLGVRAPVDQPSPLVLYPRYSLAGESSWKIRRLQDDKSWYSETGLRHSDCYPWLARSIWPVPGLIICEGETDFLAMASLNYSDYFNCDVMMVPGSNAFPNEWVQWAGHDKVWCIPDGDDGGKQMRQRISSLIPRCRFVEMKDGWDLCKLLTHLPSTEHPERTIADLLEEAQVYDRPTPVRRQSWVMKNGDASEYRYKLLDFVIKDTQLRRRGHNELVGKCPFHAEGRERTPSLFVNAERGVFNCQSCGVGGDVINYLVLKGHSKREAFKMVTDD